MGSLANLINRITVVLTLWGQRRSPTGCRPGGCCASGQLTQDGDHPPAAPRVPPLAFIIKMIEQKGNQSWQAILKTLCKKDQRKWLHLTNLRPLTTAARAGNIRLVPSEVRSCPLNDGSFAPWPVWTMCTMNFACPLPSTITRRWWKVSTNQANMTWCIFSSILRTEWLQRETFSYTQFSFCMPHPAEGSFCSSVSALPLVANHTAQSTDKSLLQSMRSAKLLVWTMIFEEEKWEE